MYDRNLIKRIKTAYKLETNSELAKCLEITPSAIDAWNRYKKIPEKYLYKCINETGVSMEWLLNDDKPTLNIEQPNNNDLSKYFIALQSVANATSKEDELIEDIKNLMKKYIGE